MTFMSTVRLLDLCHTAYTYIFAQNHEHIWKVLSKSPLVEQLINLFATGYSDTYPLHLLLLHINHLLCVNLYATIMRFTNTTSCFDDNIPSRVFLCICSLLELFSPYHYLFLLVLSIFYYLLIPFFSMRYASCFPCPSKLMNACSFKSLSISLRK